MTTLPPIKKTEARSLATVAQFLATGDATLRQSACQVAGGVYRASMRPKNVKAHIEALGLRVDGLFVS